MYMMYSTVNKKAPKYLCDTIEPFRPLNVHGTRVTSHLVLRVPPCKTTFCRNSIFYSSIPLWNNLDTEIKKAPHLNSFKYQLKSVYLKKPRRFNHNTTRAIQVSSGQMRMNFSNLKYDLAKHGCGDDTKCSCGALREDSKHFFLQCPTYLDIRANMLDKIKTIVGNYYVIFGSDSLSNDNNMLLFTHVYDYIKDSRRF